MRLNMEKGIKCDCNKYWQPQEEQLPKKMCSIQLKLASFQLSIKTKYRVVVFVWFCVRRIMWMPKIALLLFTRTAHNMDSASICLFNQRSTIKSQLFAHRQQKCSFLSHFYFLAHDFLWFYLFLSFWIYHSFSDFLPPAQAANGCLPNSIRVYFHNT